MSLLTRGRYIDHSDGTGTPKNNRLQITQRHRYALVDATKDKMNIWWLPFEKWEAVNSERAIVDELHGFLEISIEKGDVVAIRNTSH